MPLALIQFLGGGRPDNELPGGRPDRPDNSLPNLPGYPSNGLPDGGDVIDVPSHPIVLPEPPVIDNGLPPVFPGIPIHKPSPPPGGGTLPTLPPPGSVYPPLPSILPAGKYLVLVLIPGIGSRWTVIDTSLVVGTPVPPGGTPAPKA